MTSALPLSPKKRRKVKRSWYDAEIVIVFVISSTFETCFYFTGLKEDLHSSLKSGFQDGSSTPEQLTFYKVHFTEALDLVRKRSVLIRLGVLIFPNLCKRLWCLIRVQAFLFNHCAATQATTVAGKLSFVIWLSFYSVWVVFSNFLCSKNSMFLPANWVLNKILGVLAKHWDEFWYFGSFPPTEFWRKCWKKPGLSRNF